MLSDLLGLAVTTRNLSRLAAGKPYAWRVLAMLPHIKAVKDQIRSKSWLSARRSRLLHKSMSLIMQDVTAVCVAPFVARCCDTLHREVRPFVSFYTLDGAEQYAHTQCGTTQCPRGDVPRDELDNTERVCRTRKVRVLKAALLKARAEMWDDASGKPRYGQAKKVAEWQRKYKCKMDPIPWWCGDELPDQHEFFGMLTGPIGAGKLTRHIIQDTSYVRQLYMGWRKTQVAMGQKGHTNPTSPLSVGA